MDMHTYKEVIMVIAAHKWMNTLAACDMYDDD